MKKTFAEKTIESLGSVDKFNEFLSTLDDEQINMMTRGTKFVGSSGDSGYSEDNLYLVIGPRKSTAVAKKFKTEMDLLDMATSDIVYRIKLAKRSVSEFEVGTYYVASSNLMRLDVGIKSYSGYWQVSGSSRRISDDELDKELQNTDWVYDFFTNHDDRIEVENGEWIEYESD